MSIRVTQLCRNYGEQKAVSNVSFTVNKGEILGFLGPNGAGKSTTMKMITGFLKPDAGKIEVCGIDVVREPYAAKKKLGYLPESNPLYYDMYVREYLHFIASIHQVKPINDSIDRVIHQVGLNPEAAKKIGQLSKGYKQRVGLAAAIIHDPEVLVLDEPTTGLDPNQIQEIREVIRQLGRQKAILFSSHILQEVEALCKRVVIINKGTLIADSDVDTLLHQRQGADDVILELKEVVAPGFFDPISPAVAISERQWKFNTGEPEELRRQLLEFCLQQQLNVISLRTNQSHQLEEIFKTLTRTPLES